MATRVGSVIDGKYEILKQIGKGGMSIVYLAMDKRLNKQWAVKEIRKTASGKNDEIIINSLLAEANLMKRLDHPALPRIVDIIEDAQTIFVVMDYIEGESLDKILDTYGPQPQELVIEWAKQLCDALGYLHSQKPPIIYRDMKPANIMLKPEGNLKLIDFGIAREFKEANLSDTTVLGTRGYAPPEQHGSRQTDGRSDIYALGMTMHHLLTGVDPRPADYMYTPIRQWKPELSAGLERIVDKCTALDPEDRYQSANELMYALDHYEEEDEHYKKRQKKKLVAFLVTAGLMILFLVGGFVAQIEKKHVNDTDYERLIAVTYNGTQADADGYTAEDYYKEAIKLYPNRPEAYLALLDYYEEVGFGKTESDYFTGIMNNYGVKLDPESEGYWEICDRVGRMYLFVYQTSDNEDDSLRSRLIMADAYFSKIDERAAEYENYAVLACYHSIAQFYSEYIWDNSNIKEPSYATYEQLLEDINVCLNDIEAYDSEDSVYIQLEIYEQLMNLINDQRTGFAITGIDQSEVLEILTVCYERSMEFTPTVQRSIDLQNEIQRNYTSYVENLSRAYENAGEGDQ